MNAPFRIAPLAPIHNALDDLARRFPAKSCPDVVARLRADVADVKSRRAPVHQDVQCEITELFAYPLTLIGSRYDSQPQAFSPSRWGWISGRFADTFHCSPEDIDCDDDNLISVRGRGIVGFVRTRIG